MANVMFGKADSTVSLLHDIYKRQTSTEETFDSVDDDTLMEFLQCRATVGNRKRQLRNLTSKKNK
jgi:hypothetical protein